jgi:hypothetical protein
MEGLQEQVTRTSVHGKLAQIENLTIMLRATGISMARSGPELSRFAKLLELIADGIDRHADEIVLIFANNDNPISKELQ